MCRSISRTVPLLVTVLSLSSIGLGSAPAAAAVMASPAQRGVVIPEVGSTSDTVTVTNDNTFAVVISPDPPTFTITDLEDTINPPTLTNNTCNAVLIFANATCTFDINIVANNANSGDIDGGTVTITDVISVRRLFGPFLDPVTVNIEVGVLDKVPEPSSALILGAGLLAFGLIGQTAIRRGSSSSRRFAG